MIIQLVTAAVVYALVTTLIIVRPATGRRVLGLFLVAMGVGVNGALTVLAHRGAAGAPGRRQAS